jgi:diguanylate cyclase
MSDLRPRSDPIAVALLTLSSLLAALYLVWVTQANTSNSSYALIENILTVAVGMGCTSLCLYIAWRKPAQRRLWLCWGIGLLFYSVGDALWFYTEIALRLDPFPSLADAFYLLHVPLFIIGILNLPRRRFRPTEAARIGLNIAVITVALATVTWRYVVAPIIDGGGETLPFIVSLAYPLSNLVTMSLLMFYLLRPHSAPLHSEIWFLCAGIVLFSSADLVFSIRNAQNFDDVAQPYYALWPFGQVLIAAAAFLSLRRQNAVIHNPAQTLETRDSSVAMLFSPFAAILMVVSVGLFDAQPSLLERIGSQIGTLLVIGLVMARQVAALADNRRLNRDLLSLSASLERRVVDRTQQLERREQRERQRSLLLERIVQGEQPEALRTALLEFSLDDPDGAAVLDTLSTERSALMERLEWNATRDVLTGLPNRRSLQIWLEHCLSEHANVVVYVIDLDGFKRINDTLGHGAGDLLLRGVTERFIGVLPSGALLARTGGDEFVIACPLPDQSIEATKLAEQILGSLEQPFELAKNAFSINASIGFSLYPQHSFDSESLQRQADAAMYTAKSRGRGQIQSFSADINASIEQRLEVENQLRLAIANDQLELHYQPIVNIHNGSLIALEALLRWNSSFRLPRKAA